MKERQEERLSLSPYDWGKGLERGLRSLIMKEGVGWLEVIAGSLHSLGKLNSSQPGNKIFPHWEQIIRWLGKTSLRQGARLCRLFELASLKKVGWLGSLAALLHKKHYLLFTCFLTTFHMQSSSRHKADMKQR